MRKCWDVLGVPRGSDRAAIRRAYARALKVTHPEDDPQGFMALREAYESALNWVDYDDYDYDADDAPVFAEVGAVEPYEWTAPVVAPVSAEPALDPFAEDRAAEQADLRRLTAALEAGLRGPWHGDAAALTARLDAILTAPVLIEIETRDRIETWLSGLLADTVPRSDTILMRAIQAFDWEDERNRPPAVWQILARIDEWRMIRSLGDSRHRLSGGWRALTRRTAHDWQHRIGALQPDVPSQVQQLFDLADYQAPGIAHSFDRHAAAWWRDFLTKPRFGFLDLCAILTGALAAAMFAVAGPTPVWQAGGAAAALVAGIAFAVVRLRVVVPWRLRREEMGAGFGWFDWGWLLPWCGATLMLILLPVGPVEAGTIMALALIALFWMATVAGAAPRRGITLGGFLAFGGLALVGGAAFVALPAPQQLALAIFGVASTLIGSVGTGALAGILWRINRFPVVTAGLAAILLLSVAALRGWLPDVPQPVVHWGTAAIAGMVLLAAVREVADGSWAVPVMPWLRWGLWLVLVFAAIASAPPVERAEADHTLPTIQTEPPRRL